MEKYILAIDQGTTSTRAILFNKNQEAVKICQKEISVFFPDPSTVRQDAEEIFSSTVEVIKGLFEDGCYKADQIEAIGITNQRETTIIWDKTTGKPIHQAIVWQSRETSGLVEKYKEKGYVPMIKEKTGLVMDAYFSATKIRAILDKTGSNDNYLFGTVDSWLLWKLTKGKVHATDHTNASRTMLYNIHNGDWDEELCQIFDIPVSMLPKIKDTSGIFGQIDPEYLDGHSAPICCLCGDQQAALFGESCFEEGDIKNTYGTGGFLLVNTGNKVINSKKGLLSTVAWKRNGETKYALEGSIFVSGSLIQWLRDQMHFVEKSPQSEELATSVYDTAGVYIVPAFTGLGAPYWNQDARGAIFGLTRGTSIAHIVRAALESMAYQSKDLTDLMEEELGHPIQQLKVDGGASANKFLLQFQSDLLQKKVTRALNPETTALGAARFAGLACDYFTMEDFDHDENITYLPQKEKEEMDRLYQGWLKAVKACQEY